MGADTRIEWADHTFNPWTGCTRVSEACRNCYAETLARRAPQTFGGWGPSGERKRTSASYWQQPRLWNKRAEKAGIRQRVFCASMADVFDDHPTIDPTWRPALWDLIDATPNLDWLLLTKRPENASAMLPHARIQRNVWLGVTAETQDDANTRIPALLRVAAARYFVSIEPMLGPVDLLPWLRPHDDGPCPVSDPDCLGADGDCHDACVAPDPMLDWIIAGGESGAHARPSHPDWFRALRDQCQASGAAFFFKQWGEWLPRSQGARQAGSMPWGALAHDGTFSPLTTTWSGRQEDSTDQEAGMVRVGKKAAGAALDGREHRAVPA
jgi:protein gp37